MRQMQGPSERGPVAFSPPRALLGVLVDSINFPCKRVVAWCLLKQCPGTLHACHFGSIKCSNEKMDKVK